MRKTPASVHPNRQRGLELASPCRLNRRAVELHSNRMHQADQQDQGHAGDDEGRRFDGRLRQGPREEIDPAEQEDKWHFHQGLNSVRSTNAMITSRTTHLTPSFTTSHSPAVFALAGQTAQANKIETGMQRVRPA